MAEMLDTRDVPRRGEAGIALVTVMVIVIVITVLVAAVSMSLIGSSGRSAARAEYVRVQPAFDAATQAYLRGLDTGVISERTDFVMVQSDAEQLFPAQNDLGASVLPNTSVDVATDFRTTDGVHSRTEDGVQVDRFVPTSVPATNPNFTVRIATSDDRALFWQIYRIDVPTALDGGSPLAVYVRAWEGNLTGGEGTTRARISRQELSAGRFSDYQMLINSKILFGDGARINGPVHSNGTTTTSGVTVPAGDAIHGVGDVRCVGRPDGAGNTIYPVVSSAQDDVDITNLNSRCEKASNTGGYIDFGRVDSVFTQLAADCTEGSSENGVVQCFGPLSTGYDVVIGSRVVAGERKSFYIVNGVRSSDIRAGRPIGLLFDSNVRVRSAYASEGDAAAGRITIAARPVDGADSGTITITNDLKVVDPNADVVGLVAAGHVEIKPPSAASKCTDIPNGITGERQGRVVQAALIAMTGGVRLPSEYLTQYPVSGAPDCKWLLVEGSISSHLAPVLQWSWSLSGTQTGFDNRSYKWNRGFGSVSPPYFPTTRSWESRTSKEANADCLGARGLDWSCR